MRTSQLKVATEVVAQTFTDAICAKDAAGEPTIVLIGEKGDREYDFGKLFLAKNSDQYYVSINCWLLLIEEKAGKLARLAIQNYLELHGLLDTIALADAAASHLIGVLSGNVVEVPDDAVQLESLLSTTSLKDSLTCLRFLKRFTVVSSARLELATYSKFDSIQSRLNWRSVAKATSSDPDVEPPTNKWVSRVAGWISDLIGDWKNFLPQALGQFGNGNCSDAATYIDKMRRYSQYEHFLHGCALYQSFLGAQEDVSIYEPPKCITVIGVPKSYKTYRTIAPETAYASYELQKVRKALIACASQHEFWELIDVESQKRQQDRAYLGSLDGSFVTIDLSGASDSIALYWARQVFPADLMETILPLRSRQWNSPISSTPRTLSTFLTSGNPTTFFLETCFFWAILMVAREEHLFWTYGPDVDPYSSEMRAKCPLPSSFGDDMIVSADYVDEAFNLLDIFQLEINFTKTFAYGDYRESCGCEYFQGSSLKGTYWPRTHILSGKKPHATDYASLVSLQHRVYDYPQAREFLAGVVRFFWKNVTVSHPEFGGVDESTDLWGPWATSITRHVPYGAYWKDDYDPEDYSDQKYFREVHTGVTTSPNGGAFKSLPVSDQVALETWLYADFLATGPRFASKLDELLGVSEPVSRDVFVSKPQVAVGLVRP